MEITSEITQPLKDKDDLLLRLKSEGKLLRKLMGQPLSVFFSAQRSEDYDEGGEDYLTFNGKFNLLSLA